MSSLVPFVGVLVEVTSYTTARALVVQTQGYTGLVTYGNLAVIEDAEDSRLSYLATVTDVRERGVLPSIDQKALEQLYTTVATSGAVRERIDKAIQEIIFPGAHRQYSLREVELRILGVLKKDANRYYLEPHKRPPRPYSKIYDAKPNLVNGLLAYDCGLMVLGEHYVIRGALATLDPSRLDTHLAIVGQTGSGKTETVKRVALEFHARVKDPKSLIILDVAGEYLGFPYTPSASGSQRVVPLFEAILDPAGYVCEPRSSCASKKNSSPPGMTTILVPYNTRRIGSRKKDETGYFQKGYPPLLVYVDSVLGGQGRSAVPVLFGRHSIYTIDKGRLIEIELYQAWHDVETAQDLVVAAPAPDALSVDEIVEFSGTQSEYAPVLIMHSANGLGLLEEGLVTGVTLLSSLVDLYLFVDRYAIRGQSREQIFRDIGSRIVTGIDNLARNRGQGSIGLDDIRDIVIDAVASVLGKRVDRQLVERSVYVEPYSWWYLITLPLWRWWDPQTFGSAGIQAPFNMLDPGAILAALDASDPDYGGRSQNTWRHTLPDRLSKFATAFSRYDGRTIASVAYALRKVSFMVSPALYYEIYKEIIARMLREEFGLVLLAPPSTGASELPVARLLQAAFDEAVRQYQPGGQRRLTLLVAEEAHNLAPAKGDPVTKPFMVRIAREGRKWGLGLAIVTQRPGFVDADVLSQAATLVALRVTNPEDISSLRRSVESASKELADRLPDLDRGQALISGMAVPERRIPLMAEIAMVGARCPSQQQQQQAQGGGAGQSSNPARGHGGGQGGQT